MRLLRGVSIASGCCSASLLLAACSGSASQVGLGPAGGSSPIVEQSAQDAARHAVKVYVSKQGSQTVGIYNPAGHQGGMISGFGTPAGLAVDGAQNLYVADELDNVVNVSRRARPRRPRYSKTAPTRRKR